MAERTTFNPLLRKRFQKISVGVGGGGDHNFNLTLFVDPVNGDNATAVINSIDKPWKTVTAADTAAQAVSGSLVHWLPGSYGPTNAYDLNHVRHHIENGAKWFANDADPSPNNFLRGLFNYYVPTSGTITDDIFITGSLEYTNLTGGGLGHNFIVSTQNGLNIQVEAESIDTVQIGWNTGGNSNYIVDVKRFAIENGALFTHGGSETFTVNGSLTTIRTSGVYFETVGYTGKHVNDIDYIAVTGSSGEESVANHNSSTVGEFHLTAGKLVDTGNPTIGSGTLFFGNQGLMYVHINDAFISGATTRRSVVTTRNNGLTNGKFTGNYASEARWPMVIMGDNGGAVNTIGPAGSFLPFQIGQWLGLQIGGNWTAHGWNEVLSVGEGSLWISGGDDVGGHLTLLEGCTIENKFAGGNGLIMRGDATVVMGAGVRIFTNGGTSITSARGANTLGVAIIAGGDPQDLEIQGLVRTNSDVEGFNISSNVVPTLFSFDPTLKNV